MSKYDITAENIIARAKALTSGPFENYQVEDDDPSGDTYGSTVAGPGAFVCRLGEPEDCTWFRDGAEALQRLNKLNVIVAELLGLLGHGVSAVEPLVAVAKETP